MLSISEKIQRSIFSLQRRLHDNLIEITGTKSTSTFLIKMNQDKYQNKEYIIESYNPISVRIEFPGNEIPVGTMCTNKSSDNNNILHLYDILPITCFTKFEDDVTVGNMILYKVKTANNKHQTLVLQFMSPIAQINRVAVVYQEWVVVPVTDHAVLKNPALKQIINKYEIEDNW